MHSMDVTATSANNQPHSVTQVSNTLSLDLTTKVANYEEVQTEPLYTATPVKLNQNKKGISNSDDTGIGNLPDLSQLVGDAGLKKNRKRKTILERSVSLPDAPTYRTVDNFVVPTCNNTPLKSRNCRSSTFKQGFVTLTEHDFTKSGNNVSSNLTIDPNDELTIFSTHSLPSSPNDDIEETSNTEYDVIDLTVVDNRSVNSVHIGAHLNEDNNHNWEAIDTENGLDLSDNSIFQEVLINDIPTVHSSVNTLETFSQNSTLSCDLENFESNVVTEIDKAFEESIVTNSISPLIKQELQCTIQCRRLSRGEPELILDPEQPYKTYELSSEEVQKKYSRRRQNRTSAVKARVRARQHEERLVKTITSSTKEQARLKKEIKSLQENKRSLLSHLRDHLHVCFKSDVAVKHLQALKSLTP